MAGTSSLISTNPNSISVRKCSRLIGNIVRFALISRSVQRRSIAWIRSVPGKSFILENLCSPRACTMRRFAYFLRIPVSVFERLLMALLAAGVSTAFPDDEGILVFGLVCVAPKLFPEDPRRRALSVWGVFEALFAVPPESEPLDEAPPDEPPDVCANEVGAISKKQAATQTAENLMAFPRGSSGLCRIWSGCSAGFDSVRSSGT